MYKNYNINFYFLVKSNKHEGDLVQLLQKVPRSEYVSLGVHLGLKKFDIDNEIYRPKSDPKNCLINVISVWLRMSGKDHTWGILASALRNIKHKNIAAEVENTYNLKEVGMSIYQCGLMVLYLGKCALLCDVSYSQYKVMPIFQVC